VCQHCTNVHKLIIICATLTTHAPSHTTWVILGHIHLPALHSAPVAHLVVQLPQALMFIMVFCTNKKHPEFSSSLASHFVQVPASRLHWVHSPGTPCRTAPGPR
jgi:hypothetical protein